MSVGWKAIAAAVTILVATVTGTAHIRAHGSQGVMGEIIGSLIVLASRSRSSACMSAATFL